MKSLSADLEKKLQKMELAALAAGKELYAWKQSGKPLKKELKADGSIILPLDTECQRIVFQTLGDELPLVGEEDAASHKLIQTEESFFLVDPLDGTSACRRFLNSDPGQVGFGPLIGYLEKGTLRASVYLDFPRNQLLTAIRGMGTWISKVDLAGNLKMPELSKRERLLIDPKIKLVDCAALFYIGRRIRGELEVIEALRRKDVIETAYRFGGFANDCSRLSRGLEQIIVQFHVKPWDASAVLFPLESGYSIILDPMENRVALEDWRVAAENPLVIVPAHLREEFVRVLEDITF